MMDLALLYGIQAAVGCPLLDAVMPVITALGEYGIMWLAVAAALLVQRKYRAWGIVMVIAIAAVYILGMWVVKPLVARPRPFAAVPDYPLLIAAPSDYSFPSGHASASFAAATVICFIPTLKKGWKVGAVAFAALIAFSRLYLFVHYPTDVLAGIVLGIALGALAAIAYRRIARGRAARGNAENGLAG